MERVYPVVDCPGMPLAPYPRRRHICGTIIVPEMNSACRTCYFRRSTGKELQNDPRGRWHLLCARTRVDHGTPGRQWRRQDYHHCDDSRLGDADIRQRARARRRNAAATLSRTAPDELREPLYRHAAPAYRTAES